jgi:arylsulfatase A-like enzyme
MTSTRPNVVIMLADDMGFSDIGCYGGEIPTPNIDRLAAGGTRLSEFYNTARCSPSRASLLTGLHPHQTGIGELVNDDGPGGYPGSLNDRCAVVAETLGAAGYRTGMVGKWHLSNSRVEPDGSWPTRRGFGEFWGTIGGAASYFRPTTLHAQEEPIDAADLPEGFYYTDEIGRRASAYVTDAAAGDAPFLAYVAFTAPHWPLHALPEDVESVRGRFDAGWDDLRVARRARQVAAGLLDGDATLDRRDPVVPAWDDEPERDWQRERMEAYAAQVVAMDRAVGRVLDALEEAGVADDTLVLFLSDNGGCAEELSADADHVARFRTERLIIPPHAEDGSPIKVGNDPSIHPGTEDTYSSYGIGWANLSNTPFRLYKRWVHEGGISTPLIVRWPAGGVGSGAIADGPHQLTDVVPTVLAAAGVAAPTERAGVPLPTPPGHSMLGLLRGEGGEEHDLFWEHIGNAAYRRGRWKLVREDGDPWELYDLAADRSESHDLAAEHPELVEELAAAWQDRADAVGVIPYPQVLAARATSKDQPL